MSPYEYWTKCVCKYRFDWNLYYINIFNIKLKHKSKKITQHKILYGTIRLIGPYTYTRLYGNPQSLSSNYNKHHTDYKLVSIKNEI